MKHALFFLLFLLFSSVVLHAQQVAGDLENRADSLFENAEEQEALEVYQQILDQNPDHYTALWRTSLLYSRIGNRQDSEEEQRDYFDRAKMLAEQALEVDSTDTQSNFVMAVAMGRMALIAGARERVAASRAIKKYADKAIELDRSNPGAWHVLGRWHFKIANLNFIERAAANTLFGGIPGDASNEKAVESMQRAIELMPDYILYHHDLAMVYEDMGQTEDAIAACRNALEIESHTPDDPMLKEECREWIQDWQ